MPNLPKGQQIWRKTGNADIFWDCGSVQARTGLGHRRGKAAAARLGELCDKKFKIESLGRGKYGRILAVPYTADDRSICQILVDEGHAVEYFGGKKVKVWG